jgi:murein DD-endopeptidase MepM/ murein hydrolase activator NlpD
MDQKPYISLINPDKMHKIIALLALFFAFTLPVVLVKIFPHKPKKADVSYVSLLPPIIIKNSTASKTNLTPSPPVNPVKEIPAKVSNKEQHHEEDENWKMVIIRKGDSLAQIFKRVGLSAKLLHTIVKSNSNAKMLTRLKPNQELQFQIQKNTLQKLIIPFSNTQTLVIQKVGNQYQSQINTRKMDSKNQFVTATVYGSLYSTAKKYNIPSKLIRQMTEIFMWNIDFAKNVRAGDQFTLVYKTFYINGKLVNTGDLLAASYRSKGKVYQAVQHTNKAGQTDYFTPQGISLKKAFNRYPIRFSHISSSFSLSRYHPILHYMRAHKGVDLAARIGTPIMATGSGRIEFIGRNSGYGNMIKIKHDKTYSSIYGHMLKFQKGLSKGSYVRRGQLIGYVGQTGLASGPHCHYEFHVHGQPKNPTTVNLPRGLAISGRELATFKANSNILLAQLKQFELRNLASNEGGKAADGSG